MTNQQIIEILETAWDKDFELRFSVKYAMVEAARIIKEMDK